MTTATEATLDSFVKSVSKMAPSRKRVAILMLAEDGLTLDDVLNKTERARAASDLILRSIIFAVEI